MKLSSEYEAKQQELTEKINAEQKEVDTYEQDKNDFDSFAAVIRKYVGITALTPTIVNEILENEEFGSMAEKAEIITRKMEVKGMIHFPNLTKNLAPIVLHTLKFSTIFKTTFITIPTDKRMPVCVAGCDTG